MIAIEQNNKWLDKWFYRRTHFQRLAASDPLGCGGLRPIVPHRVPCCNSWCIGWMSPTHLPAAASCQKRHHFTVGSGARRGDRFPFADSLSASVCHIRSCDCLHWASSACDSDLRRTARRGTPPAGLLDILSCWQLASGRLRPDSGGGSSPLGDAYMLASIVVCGLGYAEGARLSRRLGYWQVISWALVLSLPLMLPLSFYFTPDSWSSIGVSALLSLAYVSLFSMLIGFVFWYRGLAQGGIASVGQLQLLQPFFGLLLASVILHEKVGWALVAVNIAVIMCVAGARRFAK